MTLFVLFADQTSSGQTVPSHACEGAFYVAGYHCKQWLAGLTF